MPGAFIIRHKKCSIESQKKKFDSRNKVVSNQGKL